MSSQACQRRGSSGIGDGAAFFEGPPPPPLAGGLPLCDLLYSSWGGSPPFGAADMQMYERWRCRTLALRSLSCLSSEDCYPMAAPTDGKAPEEEGPNWVSNTSTNKLDKIEEEEARRAEGFLLLRRCLPKGLPMDLVERTAWAECVSFFCKRESSNFLRNCGMSCSSLMQPVSLPSLVARLAHRLWFLLPGGPLFFSASLGGADLLEALPPWVSFLCEELAAFFLFVLLHMKAIIEAENGVYVHLTDREWSARFRQLKWLLSFDSPLLFHPPSALTVAEGNREETEVHPSDKKEMAFQTTIGERTHLDFPPLECIDTSLSEHFPMNPQSAPHSFWLLFDRRSFSWVVCTESYALRSFPVLDQEGAPLEAPPSEGAPLEAPPSEGAPGVQQRKKRPLPSLVDAAREDALRFLCLLGAVTPASLSGNTTYLSSLHAEEETTEEPFSQQQQQQQLLLPEAARAWTDESPVQSEATPRWDLEGGLEQEEHKRRESDGPNVDSAVSTADEERVMLQLHRLQPAAAAAAATAAAAEEEQRRPFGWAGAADRGEAISESSSKQREAAAAAAATAAPENDSSTELQLIESPLSSEGEAEELEEQTEGSRASRKKFAQKRKSSQQQQQQHKRRKQQKQQQQTKQQQQQQITTKPHRSKEREQQQQETQQQQQHKKQQQRLKEQQQQHSEKRQPQQHKKQQQQQQHGEKQQQHSEKQQQQRPRLQQMLEGLLQGGRKQLCGGRVLIGLRHKNGLLDTRLVSFCRSLNGKINTNCVTEQACLAAVQGYLQQHCERQKKVYLCDERLKALTGRERLPHQREALGKALKMAGLIEHFMIDPKDLKEA